MHDEIPPRPKYREAPPRPAEPGRALYSIPETQHKLGGVCRPVVNGMMQRGEIDRVVIGRRVFVTAASIDRFIASQVAAQSDPAQWVRSEALLRGGANAR